jgi:hypothetical protein
MYMMFGRGAFYAVVLGIAANPLATAKTSALIKCIGRIVYSPTIKNSLKKLSRAGRITARLHTIKSVLRTPIADCWAAACCGA